MPFATCDGVRTYWRLDGSDGCPPLVLLNSIGTDMSLWDAAMPYLLPAFRPLRLDMRGHGASDAPTGDYTLSMLSDDVVAVLDAAGIDTAVVAGVSLGGMVAMQLALDHPERVGGLALICTSPAMDPRSWDDRIEKVRREGTAAIAAMAIERFLSEPYRTAHPGTVEGMYRALVAQPDHGYAGAGAAIRDMRLSHRIPGLAVPTLVVTGELDISTPFKGHGERLVSSIPGARHVSLVSAHLAPVEAPAALGAALRQAFTGSTDVDEAAGRLFEAGLINRRRILGDQWVDRALSGRTPFNADYQAMITRIAWQEIWGRPGLDDRTRRLLVLAITASLSRWEEFALHVRSGLMKSGFTQDELKEVLMQTAIYAGLPAANTAFVEASRVIAELEDGMSGTCRTG